MEKERWKRLCLGVLSAAAGLLATSAGISEVLDRWPELRQAERSVAAFKTRSFARNHDAFEIVFVGSSHVVQGFDPAAFDAELELAGRPLRSFNLGFNGMWLLELAHVVEGVLDERPANLRYLLIEPRDIDVNPVRLNALTDREVDWHEPDLTLDACRAVMSHDCSVLDKLDVAGLHVRTLFQRVGNVGVAWRLLLRRPWSVTDADTLPYDGYLGRRSGGVPVAASDEVVQVLGRPVEGEGEGRGEAEAPAGARRDAGGEARGRPENDSFGVGLHAGTGEPTPLLLELFAELVERVRDAGIEPLFVIPPGTDPKLARRLHELGALPELLDYSQSIPEMVARPTDYFASYEHLNPRGARLFSQALARDLAARIPAGDGR